MTDEIRHMVIFNLKDDRSISDSAFIENSRKILGNIPGVVEFEVVNQVSPKTKFKYGFSMSFENEEIYAAYKKHSDHDKYIVDYWLKYVKDFIEIDFKGYRA